MNEAAPDIPGQLFEGTFLWGKLPGEELLGNSTFNFLRNYQTVFQSGNTTYTPHQQYMRVLTVPYLTNTSCCRFIFALLVAVQWYDIVF